MIGAAARGARGRVLASALSYACVPARPVASLAAAVDREVRAAARALGDVDLGGRQLVSVSKFSDYQTSAPMVIAPALRKKPTDVAESLTTAINAAAANEAAAVIRSASISKTFVNLTLSDEYLAREVTRWAEAAGGLPPLLPPAAGRTLVDFSSPNMGKELHVGHLRSSVIGDTIARLLEALHPDGASAVDRVSHVGDAGLPMALVVAAFRSLACTEAGAGRTHWAALPPRELLAVTAAHRQAAGGEPSSALPSPSTPAGLVALPSPAELSSVYERAKKATTGGTPESAAFNRDVQSTLRALQGALSKYQRIRHDGLAGSAAAASGPMSPFSTVLPLEVDADVLRSAAATGEPVFTGDEQQLLAQWQAVCAASKAGFAPLLRRLHVRVNEMGEASYSHLVEAVVADVVASGVAVESDGAICIFVDGPDKPPFLIRKADGGFLYATTDMAALRFRLTQGYARIIYVTDVAQSAHFKQLFAAARMCGWISADGTNMVHPARGKVSLEHAHFGLVTGVGGKKLSSRDGTDLTLAALLDEGVAAVQTASRASGSGESRAAAGSGVPPLPATPAAPGGGSASNHEAIATSAIRYFDLSHNKKSDYAFSYEKALAMRGNTAPYLLYGTTRIAAILRQAQAAALLPAATAHGAAAWPALCTRLRQLAAVLRGCPVDSIHPVLSEPAERQLALHLLRFSDNLDAALATLQPHSVTEYLFDLATCFHGFYEKCRVLPPQETLARAVAVEATGGSAGAAGDDEVAVALHRYYTRSVLCRATDKSLRAGFKLVGLEAVEHM